VTIKPQTVHGRQRWRVSWRSAGKRFRRFLPTKAAAEAFASSTKIDLRELGSAWGALTQSERAELVATYQRAKERGYSVSEACRFWEANGTATASGVTVGQLIDRCIEAKQLKGLRPESLRLLAVTLKQFRTGRDHQPAASIQAADVAKWQSSRSD
jgi:hypothetical protein